ncbi:MAG TPA: VOC family protein [Alphaproteobacteria bacterium]|jgi:predicted enzyme related to lactoylglutathione lyase|nr:VOC family protein [Alphaproteobacteria bacterium]
MGPARLIASGHEGGPTGMLNALGHPPENYVTVYIQVDDLEAALDRVAEAGGKTLVPPVPLPDGRRFAWVNDTAGNIIALLTPMMSA